MKCQKCACQHNINLDPVFVVNALLVCTYVVRFNLKIVVNMYVGQCEAFSADFFVIVHIRSRAFFRWAHVCVIRRHFEVMKISQRHVDDFGALVSKKVLGSFGMLDRVLGLLSRAPQNIILSATNLYNCDQSE